MIQYDQPKQLRTFKVVMKDGTEHEIKSSFYNTKPHGITFYTDYLNHESFTGWTTTETASFRAEDYSYVTDVTRKVVNK